MHRIASRFFVASLAGSFLAGTAAAQFGNEWVSFHEDTNGRLVSSPGVGDSDGQEKDYAWADLDQDGWTDLVVARKQPFTTTGKRVNVLFMNEGGFLMDRTAAYASASDVPGDQGFEQPTNDRDVVITDVDLDGWLDVVTATALGFSDPKHISHPRVYRNLGSSGGGWLGLLHEDARFPQLFTSAGLPKAPAFCGVAAGDVTGSGYPDLHFTDYDTGGGSGSSDLNDRLLINDGAGFFVDESFLRMTGAMLGSNFGTSSEIVDLNLNGIADIVKNEDGDGEAFYNDPANVGFFNILEDIQDGSPYFVSTGDLNNDGRIDVIWSDDGSDRYRYNTGVDPLGRVIWGSNKTFSFLSGSDDGFGGNSLATDLDGDGWQDVIVTDVDVDISGCNRRIHIYHNPGGAVGAQITLVEEAQQSGGSGWKGVKGILADDLKGGHDVAVFDIDLDGDQDMILGRCSGTDVWINETAPLVCQTDLGFDGPGTVTLSICGGPLESGKAAFFTLADAPPFTTGILAVGDTFNPTFLAGLGATAVPIPPLFTFNFPTGASGTFTAPVLGGGGPLTFYAQAGAIDLAQPSGFQVSNAVQVDFLP